MKVPPKIWIPRRDIIHAGDLRLKELHENIMNVRARAAGFYRIWKMSGRYGRQLVAEFPNLLTNAFYDRFATAATLTYCQVGTGNTAPAATDSSLVSYVNYTGSSVESSNTYVAGPPDYIQYSRTFRFNAGQATGTLAEVGMAWTTGPGNLMSRALILDSGGSPTTITVLSDEVLDVEYRYRWYPPASDVTGTLTLSGTPYTYTLRPAFVGTTGWNAALVASGGVTGGMFTNDMVYGPGATLGARTSQPSGTPTASMSPSISTVGYSNGTYYRQANYTIPLIGANISGGFQAMTCGFNMGAFQVRFDTPIPKDSSKVMTFSIRLGWGPH